MNNVLLAMCFMGSITYICYLAIYKIFKYNFLPKQRLLLLSVSVFFFLFPTPLLGGEIRKVLNLLLLPIGKSINLVSTNGLYFIPSSKIIPVMPNGEAGLPYYPKVFWLAMVLWIAVFVIVLFSQIKKYWKIRKVYLDNSYPLSGKDLFKYGGLVAQINKKNIQIRIFPNTIAPFTIGYLKPIIYLSGSMTVEQEKLILQHEIYHISHFDNIIKLLGLFTILMHWYCPITLLLFKNLCHTLELVCDQKVIKYMSNSSKREYARLLLDCSCYSQENEFQTTFISQNIKIIEERVNMIKNSNKKRINIATLPIILSLFLCSSTVLAYQSPVERRFDSPESYNSGYTEMIIPETLELKKDENAYVIRQDSLFKNYDSYFLLDNGDVKVPSEFSSLERVSCKHNYNSGIYRVHTADSSGGCWVYDYQAKYCSKCAYILSKTLLTKTYNVKCSHK